VERRSALGGVAPGPSVWRGRLSRLGVQDAQRRLRISLSIAFGLTDSAGGWRKGMPGDLACISQVASSRISARRCAPGTVVRIDGDGVSVLNHSAAVGEFI
jgi:hypothetical protein